MRARIIMVLAVVISLAPTLTKAAGWQSFEIPADAGSPALRGAVWYPCAQAPTDVVVGPFTLPMVKDCAPPSGKHPLIVVSHGRGGTLLGHHDTAETLADAGFIVAAINHAGDTARDLGHSNDLSIFVTRPAQIKRLIDFMLDGSPLAANIDSGHVGFFGFSRGGYTGLVLVGANPDWNALRCNQQPDSPLCRQIANGDIPREPVVHDSRIIAAAIADPLAIFFTAKARSFADVKVPIQLWASERGGDGVLPEAVAGIDKGLPAPHDYHVVANSGHFAFFAPCPPALTTAAPEICTDAPGFDRAAFHKTFNAAVLDFFRQHLGGS
jgi:predicted dienelactone hydrolase